MESVGRKARSVHECMLRLLMLGNDNRVQFISVLSVNEKALLIVLE